MASGAQCIAYSYWLVTAPSLLSNNSEGVEANESYFKPQISLEGDVFRHLSLLCDQVVRFARLIHRRRSQSCFVPISDGRSGTPVPESKPWVGIYTNLEYNFYDTYAIGVDASYWHPFTEQFDDEDATGVNDVGLYLKDLALWKNDYLGLKLAAKLSLILPTSPESQFDTMKVGGSESLILDWRYSDFFNVSYTFAANEYQYQYMGFEADDGTDYWNIRASFMNKLMAVYEFIRGVKLNLGGEVETYNDFSNQTYNIYAISTGLSFDLNKNASIDFGVKTYMKDPGTNPLWNGPATSYYFYDAKGTIFSMGTTIKI